MSPILERVALCRCHMGPNITVRLVTCARHSRGNTCVGCVCPPDGELMESNRASVAAVTSVGGVNLGAAWL